MTQISEDIKNKVKDRADIVEVIGRSITLKKHGRNHIGICPFHSDKAPSLTVSPQKGIYTCFACGAHGDVINFVKENEHLSYVEAVKSLANQYHIELPVIPQTAEEIAKEKQRESIYLVLQESNTQFATNLTAFKAADDYVRTERQISDETRKLYQIGYALTDNQITREFPKRSFSMDLLLASGMSAISDEKKFQYDVFRQRITFPYLDNYGRPVGFTGRITDNTAKAAKYLNSGDTLVFNKGQVLFGLFQAKESISKMNKVYLLEGQFDVVSVAQRGVRNVIAGSGTALTDAQARLLKRFTNTVVMMYDPDSAGLKASIANAKTLLAHGFDVKAILLPDGKDPDDFAKATIDQDLNILLTNRELDFIEYFFEAKKVASASDFENTQLLDLICECISVVPDKYLRDKYAGRLATTFETTPLIIKERIKPTKELKVDKWKHGFYGIEDALELMESDDDQECSIVFDQKDFINDFSETPMVLVVGTPTLIDVQSLRSKISKLTVKEFKGLAPNEDCGDTKPLVILKNMHKNGFDISVDYIIKDVQTLKSFCDYYTDQYSSILADTFDGSKKGEIIGRCAEVISDIEATVRVVMIDEYAKKLGLKVTALDKVLKPFLAKRKDKTLLDNQRLGAMNDALNVDAEIVPDYVQNDKVLSYNCTRWGFYPLADKGGRFCSYMFRNNAGGSFSSVSDCYIKPLLHVYDNENDNANNKRVIQLCHLDPKLDRYVELKSNVFTLLAKMHETLVNEGSYNFWGNKEQFSRIWVTMSYGFRKCRAIRTFGQNPKGFFAFGNAIYHKVDNEYKIEPVDELGLVSHNEENYYSPVFSKIRISEEGENTTFNQARNLVYRDIPFEKQISFEDWSGLMNRVYNIGDNGKWAILFAITCAFRDYIFEMRRYFTALFFIGPTSSGKSQIAESIRNLYMVDTTPAFNLNIGSDAGFSMILESIRNVPVVMEEYNDRDISKSKFQGLKAATLDGEGRIKVKDVNSKQLDSSAINASIILLGQEAAQQDDGALSNRCIMCDVPHRAGGDFTDEDTEKFNLLKDHEKTGLSNILLQVLELRPLFEKKYLTILSEETKKLKDSVRISVTNTEGMTRIINACALMTSTCRLIEENAPHMKLPFSYLEFVPIAEKKVLNQLERISSTNKLSTYFQTISTLITHNKIKIGREIKINSSVRVTRMLSSKKMEEVDLPMDTKVLYVSFESVYSLYSSTIGRDESLSRQSLKSYFESNQAYIGLTNSCRFKWEEAEMDISGNDTTVAADGESVNVSNYARMKMKPKSSITSAYMFNYNILKSLIDIDFERNVEVNEKGEKVPEGNDIPF